MDIIVLFIQNNGYNRSQAIVSRNRYNSLEDWMAKHYRYAPGSNITVWRKQWLDDTSMRWFNGMEKSSSSGHSRSCANGRDEAWSGYHCNPHHPPSLGSIGWMRMEEPSSSPSSLSHNDVHEACWHHHHTTHYMDTVVWGCWNQAHHHPHAIMECMWHDDFIITQLIVWTLLVSPTGLRRSPCLTPLEHRLQWQCGIHTTIHYTSTVIRLLTPELW